MKNIARASKKDREALFRNTAEKYRMTEAIIEKDFWVCWTLMYLFNESPWNEYLAFKGGTSLSKGYDIIERFSEDIDLILNWELLGYSIDEPWMKRTKTQQGKYNTEINNKASNFLENVMLPRIKKDFNDELIDEFRLFIDKKDPQTICFEYPKSYEDKSILSIIRLEIGPLAAWTPSSKIKIIPYAAIKYPTLFEMSSTNVLTVKAERTFWEKITILHKEAFRKNGNMPQRYSRHYYDVERLASSIIKEKAFSELDILRKVIDFKSKFYPANVARYDLAKPGTIKLMPPIENMEFLKTDYLSMQNMIFGKKIPFDFLMINIKKLEDEINLL